MIEDYSGLEPTGLEAVASRAAIFLSSAATREVAMDPSASA
jgi:hypothetical protein